jgi:hypothetical protein
MAGRKANLSDSTIVNATISVQSERVLTELAKRGIWGRNAGEVAGRFIDQAVERFIEAPRFEVSGERIKEAKP